MSAQLIDDSNWLWIEDQFEEESHAKTPADVWGLRLTLLVGAIWAAGLVVGFETALAAMVVLGFAAAVSGLIWPQIGLFGAGIICTVDALMRTYLMTGGLLRWNTFNYWLVLVMLLAFPLILRLRDYQSIWFRLFSLLLLAELMMSPGPMLGLNHILNFVCLLGLQVYFIRAARDRHAYLWLGIVCGAVAAAGGLIYFLQRESLERIDHNAFSYFPLTGIFAICMAFPSAIALGKGVKVLGTLAAICGCWLVLIASRGGMLVGTICILFLLASIPGKTRKLSLLIIGAAVLIGVTSQFAALRENSFGRVAKLLDSDISASSRTSGRSDLLLGAWFIFCEHPQGVGTGGFAPHWARVSVEKSRYLSGYKKGQQQSCHSAWMKTLAENGVPGVLLLAGYVFSFAVTGWRRQADGLLLLGALVTFCLSFAFISTEFAGKGLWLLAAGVTVLLDDRTEDVRNEDYYV